MRGSNNYSYMTIIDVLILNIIKVLFSQIVFLLENFLNYREKKLINIKD